MQFSSGSRQKVLIEISDNILLQQRLKSEFQCGSKIRADIIFLRTKYLTYQVISKITWPQNDWPWPSAQEGIGRCDPKPNQICLPLLFVYCPFITMVNVLALSLVNCTKTNTFFIYTQKLHNQPMKIYSNFDKKCDFYYFDKTKQTIWMVRWE